MFTEVIADATDSGYKLVYKNNEASKFVLFLPFSILPWSDWTIACGEVGCVAWFQITLYWGNFRPITSGNMDELKTLV